MRNPLLLILISAAAALPGQTMLEHANVMAPAATGASAGAVIGQGLGRVLGAAAFAAEAASKPVPSKVPSKATPPAENKAVAPVAEAAAPMGGFGGFGGTAPVPVRVAAGKAAVVSAPAPVEPVIPAAVIPLITRDQLIAQVSAIQPGALREDLLAKMGKPAYRVSFDEDGKFFERYRFRAAGEDVVSIELLDGVVSAVKPFAR